MNAAITVGPVDVAALRACRRLDSRTGSIWAVRWVAVGCLAVLVAWLPLALFGEQAYGVALECAALVKDDVTLTVFFRARRTLVGLAWPDVYMLLRQYLTWLVF